MRPEPLSPRDALHFAALRGAKRRAEDLCAHGRRRDDVVCTYMLGALEAARSLQLADLDPLFVAVDCVLQRGYREVLTQLHVLEGKR